MLRDTPIAYGKLIGVIYDFDRVGDELQRHTHTPSDVHISIVARGSFKMFGDGWEQIVSAGAVIDWDPGVYHGFVAVEDNSRLVNIVKG